MEYVLIAILHNAPMMIDDKIAQELLEPIFSHFVPLTTRINHNQPGHNKTGTNQGIIMLQSYVLLCLSLTHPGPNNIQQSNIYWFVVASIQDFRPDMEI